MKQKPENTNHFTSLLYMAGGLLLLVAAVLYPTQNQHISVFVFSAGAVLLITFHFWEAMKVRKTADFRLRRIQGLYFLVSVLLIPAAWLMFKGFRLWIALLLIYCVSVFYLSFREGKK